MPVELLIGPTKKVFTSLFNFILFDLRIELAPSACISPEKINLEPTLSEIL